MKMEAMKLKKVRELLDLYYQLKVGTDTTSDKT